MSECKCDLRTKLVGDGCRYCNPQDYIDHLHDALEQESTWVGLTDEEIMEPWPFPTRIEFARAIEAKLKEKNT